MTPRIRLAVPNDVPALLELDESCFPADTPHLDPTLPGELEAAVHAGLVSVADLDGTLVGMLSSEEIGDEHVAITRLAVHPAQELDAVGGALVRDFATAIEARDPRPAATMIARPDDLATLRLLVSNGFVVRRGLRDYLGTGDDRFYCQLRPRRTAAEPDDRLLIPAASVAQVLDLIEDESHAITAVLPSRRGDLFEVSRVNLEGEESLKVEEASIGVAQAGAIAAGFTFLLGISFTVPNYSVSLRTLLLLATIFTAGALQVYASATTGRARTRDDSFAVRMKWGNLLLEFWGLYPLVIVLPSVFDQATTDDASALLVAVPVAVALAAYEYSPFSFSSQHRRGILQHVLAVATIALPLLARLMEETTGGFALWSLIVGVVMMLRIASYLPRDAAELAVPSRRFRTRRRR